MRTLTKTCISMMSMVSYFFPINSAEISRIKGSSNKSFTKIIIIEARSVSSDCMIETELKYQDSRNHSS